VDNRVFNDLRESEAALLVAAVLGGVHQKVDVQGPGAVDGAHDFTVLLPGGRRIALEVTTATNQAMNSTRAVMGKVYEGRYPSLKFNWSLTGRHPERGVPGPRISVIVKRADGLLAMLERAEVSSFDEYHPYKREFVDPEALRAIDDCKKIGVVGAHSLDLADQVGGAFVALSLVGGGGAVDRGQLNDVVVREAEANRQKLERAEVDERHLFVWIESGVFSAELSMHLGHAPAEGPTLPSPITTAWAATWGPGVSFGSNTARLWRVSPPGTWEMLEVPTIRQEAE
jgi:hypothetical protein